MTATPEQVRQAFESYLKAWSTNDRDLFLSVMAEDVSFCDPVGTPAFNGHEGVGKFWDFSHQGSGRTLTPVVEEMRACANEGILRFTMQVRVPEANQGLDLSIAEYVVLNDDGKIKSVRVFWDHTNASIPAGMEPFAANMAEAYEA
jgi:steroid delta-isomerase